MTKTPEAELSRVFVDKISFTGNPIQERSSFVVHAKDVIETSRKRGHVGPAFKAHGSRYRTAYRLMDGTKAICYIQLDPLQEGVSAFRIEYNPTQLTRDNLKLLQDHLQALFLDDYAEVMARVKITQLDLAVDIAHVDLNECLVSEKRRKKSTVWMKQFGNAGTIETIYIGAPRSNGQLRIYDKEKEQRATEGIELGTRLMRVEAVLVPRVPGEVVAKTKDRKVIYQTGIYLHQLSRLENPFARIQIVSAGAVAALSQKHHWRMFLRCCNHNGTHAALALLPDDVRRVYIKRLSKGAFNWWHPTRIWKKLLVAVKSLEIFPESAFDQPVVDEEEVA